MLSTDRASWFCSMEVINPKRDVVARKYGTDVETGFSVNACTIPILKSVELDPSKGGEGAHFPTATSQDNRSDGNGEKFKNLERIKIPQDYDFSSVHGLSNELKEKLSMIRPASLGQVSRIDGITPAAISVLMVALKASAK